MTEDKDLTHLRAGYVPLKEYVDSRFEAVCESVAKGEKILNTRMDGLNEFRSTLQDQNAKFITRAEYDAKHEALEQQANTLRDFMQEQKGKASQSALIATLVVSILGLVFSAVALFLGK